MSVFLSSQKIIKDWIDYNNHMNVSYYLLIFDKFGADVLNDTFKMGEHSAKTTGKSTMIVETNITYNQELKIDDVVDVNLVYYKSFLLPKNSFGCKKSFLLLVLLLLDNGAVFKYPFNLNPNGTPKLLISFKFNL